MRKVCFSCAMFLFLGMISSMCFCQNLEQIQQIYKKIGDELGGIRKENSAMQPRVFSILDQLDKMYALSKESLQENEKIKKLCDDKSVELSALKRENTSLKTDVETLKQKLTTASSYLDEQKSQVNNLLKERGDLEGKISKIETEHKKVAKLPTEKTEQQDRSDLKNELLNKLDKLAANENIPPERLATFAQQTEGMGRAEANQRKPAQPHNLNLNSTSEPSSSR